MFADEYEGLLKAYYTAIYNYCRIRMGNDHSAYDCVQEVFFILYRKMSKVDKTDKTGIWLYRTADKVMSRYRSKAHNDISIEEIGEENLGQAGSSENNYDRLSEIVSNEELDLLKDYYINGTQIGSIAEKNNISGAAVYKRIERLKARLMKHREELL